MKLKEKDIENTILQWLSLLKIGVFWKNQSTGIFDPERKIFRRSYNKFHINGVADILGCCAGKFIAIEVKTKVGRLSSSQKDFMRMICDNQGIYIIARSIDDVKIAFKQEGIL